MNVIISPDRKEIYKEFCKAQSDLPVFINPWWLDIDVGAESWDVVLVENNKQIIAALPFCFTKLKIFKGIGMPPVAPYQGYYILFPREQKKLASKLAWEQKIVKLLFTNLPKHSFFYQHFFPETKNWMPLHWLNYKQTSKYSFLINDLTSIDRIFQSFENRARTIIKKAENKLFVSEEANSDSLIHLIKSTYKKQRLKPPYEFDRLAKLTETAVSKKIGKIYIAKDADGLVHSSSFVIWDNNKAYYIIQASCPELLSDGGASLIAWQAIKDAADNKLTSFDFTGSMMPNVEKLLRSFGAAPVQRHYITKENNFLFYWLMRIKEYKKR